MQLFSILQLLLWTFTLVSAAPGLVSPERDDFYQAPSGFEKAALGTILKTRTPPAPIRSIYFQVKVKNTWQLLIRSEDVHGNPSVIVTTVFEPFNADPKKLVSYQVAEDASALKCSPSYAFQNGNGPENFINQAEMFLIQTALDQGYYVNSPDYEGLESAFTVGLLAGKSVLNSVRAVLHSQNITGVDQNADVVFWGYSGGSLASGWAAAMQPSYAPELLPRLKGAALGGWVTNITATAEISEGGLFAGLVPNAITGLGNAYPDFRKALEDDLIYSWRWPKFALAYSNCIPGSAVLFVFNRFFTGPLRYFKHGWDTLSIPLVKDILDKNTLAVPAAPFKPEIPLFVYHGQIDGIVPFKDAQRVYDAWCSEGINSFEFAVAQVTGHATEVIDGTGAALAWIKRAFAGDNIVKGCQRTVRVSNTAYPGALNGYADAIKALIKNIFGGDIGPNGENLKLSGGKLVAREAILG